MIQLLFLIGFYLKLIFIALSLYRKLQVKILSKNVFAHQKLICTRYCFKNSVGDGFEMVHRESNDPSNRKDNCLKF